MPKRVIEYKRGDQVGSRILTSDHFIQKNGRTAYHWRCVECGIEGTMIQSLLKQSISCCNDWMHQGRDMLRVVWHNMNRRCYNPKHIAYARYGGAGITVSGWANLAEFKEWAMSQGYRYKDGLQLDRIVNSKGYSPANCHFVTPSENCRNRKSNVPVTINGETKLVIEWAEHLGLQPDLIYSRLRRGWSHERAVFG